MGNSLQLIYRQGILSLISYASRAWGHSLKKKISCRLLRKIQKRLFLRVIKGYRTLVMKNCLLFLAYHPQTWLFLIILKFGGNYLSNSLDTLNEMIPVSLSPHPSSRKLITVETYKGIRRFIFYLNGCNIYR